MQIWQFYQRKRSKRTRRKGKHWSLPQEVPLEKIVSTPVDGRQPPLHRDGTRQHHWMRGWQYLIQVAACTKNLVQAITKEGIDPPPTEPVGNIDTLRDQSQHIIILLHGLNPQVRYHRGLLLVMALILTTGIFLVLFKCKYWNRWAGGLIVLSNLDRSPPFKNMFVFNVNVLQYEFIVY